MRILVTGFEPFGRLVDNPSQRLLGQLCAADFHAAAELRLELLPTSYAGSEQRIRALLDELHPQLCLCLGVAQNRQAICLERVAVNLDDCSLADNAGELRSGREIVSGTPLAMQSRLPLGELIEATGTGEDGELRFTISNYAGNFVCNHVYYAALEYTARRSMSTQCLFVHVPMTAECRGPREQYGWELPGQSQLHAAVRRLTGALGKLLAGAALQDA
ncbi:pyroglutamyl-peptidase I [bacterium]|nr:pyroglutamyl-peptidase I [bacterium]